MDVKTPIIAILVTLDTKECEGHYLKERISAHGGKGLLVDLSMRKYSPKLGVPDIDNDTVARAAGSTIDEVSNLERAKAQEIMIKGATKILKELLARGELDGAIGLGGSTGLRLITDIMSELPMFIPKFAVTTIISEAGSVIAGSDIVPIWSISDLTGGEKVNIIEAEVLNRAAAAVVRAAAPVPYTIEKRPTVFATQFGVTTPHLIIAKDYLTSQGYDFISFHALGITGGYTMERLIEAGMAVGVLDVTTAEVMNEVAGGVLVASVRGKLRLTAAGRLGIPQVLLPGGVDIINFWSPQTVPEKYRGRCMYEHSKGLVTLVKPDAEQMYMTGKLMAERLNQAVGPTVFIFPLRGFDTYDNDPTVKPKVAPPGVYCQRMCVEDGTVVFKPTDKPWHDPILDLHLLKALLDHLDLTSPNIELLVIDYNLNDPEVAFLSAKLLDSMIRKRWVKGQLPEVPGLQPERIVRNPRELVMKYLNG
ncbi:MAG: Tm-1-like ATP-binding domain-containing protein [Zestosphaera sp.]